MRKNKEKEESTYESYAPVVEEDLIGIGQSSDFSKAIKQMFTSDENLKMKTDLSPKQICKLNISKQMADYYDAPILSFMYSRFLGLRVSKERKGRDEAVEMTKGIATLKKLEAYEQALKGGMRK